MLRLPSGYWQQVALLLQGTYSQEVFADDEEEDGCRSLYFMLTTLRFRGSCGLVSSLCSSDVRLPSVDTYLSHVTMWRLD